jgi:NAD(P)-dependent dehydrogenase (short-subunit alcohol dehydrogenase family)
VAQQDARVTVTGRDTNKLNNIKEPGINVSVVNSNDRQATNAFFSSMGKIDHLVIALSGGKGAGNFNALLLDDLREGFEGKFWPQLNTLQAALPFINDGGSITLVTAISATAKLPGTSGLAAINGALEIMIPIIAKEVKNVRINAVSPGVVDTTWRDFLSADDKKKTFEHYAQHITVGRVAQPTEVAHAILFVMANTYMTGKIIGCDGGLA